MASIKCGVINPNYRELLNTIDQWSKSEKSRKQMKNPYEAAFRLAERDFLIDIDYLKYDNNQEILTKGRLNSFKKTLKNLNNKIDNGTLDGNFAQYFWQTSHYGKQDPVIGSYLKNMQNSSFTFRKNELRDRNSLKQIMLALEEEGKLRNLSSRYGIKNAQRELNKLDNNLAKAINNNDNAEVNRIRAQMDKLVAETHLQVFDDFINIVENGMTNAIKAKYSLLKDKAKAGDEKAIDFVKKLDDGKAVLRLNDLEMASLVKDANGNKLSKPMYRALKNYNEMMENLYTTLRNGVTARIDSIAKRLKSNGDVESANAITEIKKKLRSQLMPKYEEGFFPHYVRDLSAPFMDGLMPHLDNIQTAVNPYIKNKSKTARQVIDEMNLYISEHAKGRAKDNRTREEAIYDYNRNFLNVVSSYILDVNRFNFASFTDSFFLDAMSSVESIYKSQGSAKGYAQNIVDYVTDLHKASNGDTNISPKMRAVMRSVLGFEFISKIGINPRSAARNFTQRLLDHVEWGPVMINRMNNELKSMRFKSKGKDTTAELFIEGVLKEEGLLFEEISPQLLESGLQAPASMFNMRQWNESKGKFEIIEKSKTEEVADIMSAAASKSSWLHRKAENSNRKHTFKIAFAQMHHQLADNPMFKEQMAKRGKKGGDLEGMIRKISSNYAKNMVILNHFDYADYAKSKAFRSGIGRFMFQFQHYSMEFFERNMRIFREAKEDILAGELMPGGDARGLAKAYRLGMAYFMAPVIASILTGVNFENLVEHDTAQRAKQLTTLLTGDDDEIKEAFYGKGPIISTFGGPVTSDLIDIGVMLDLINLDDDSILTLISGMEKYDSNNQSTDLSKKLRILNSFAGRLVERHIPQIMEGRIGWAVQQELGLYPTAEAKKKQRKAKKLAKASMPPEIAQALRQLEAL
jgi:hypothetical protein